MQAHQFKTRWNRPSLTALALSTAAWMTACGGGSGGASNDTPVVMTPPTQPPVSKTIDTSALQGRWSNATATAIVLPGSNSTAQGWLLSADLSSLSVLSVDMQATITGKTYALPPPQSVTPVSGQLVASFTTTPGTLSLQGIPTSVAALTQQDTLKTTSPTADAAGTWQVSLAGTRTVTLTALANGSISGTSTTGCSYTGQLSAHSTASIYTSSLTENCAGHSTTFNGIATLNSDKTRLTLVGQTADQAQAIALPLGK